MECKVIWQKTASPPYPHLCNCINVCTNVDPRRKTHTPTQVFLGPHKVAPTTSAAAVFSNHDLPLTVTLIFKHNAHIVNISQDATKYKYL